MPRWACDVCGKDAPVMKASPSGIQYLCYEHEDTPAPDGFGGPVTTD